jgi:glucoamylase
MIGLDAWIDAQARFATGAMLGAISATHLVMERPGFGQRVIPRPGSVLASPVPAHYDPEPDYFFHWFRDSSIVIDALRTALAAGYVGSAAVGRFREFVQFSLALQPLDGREFLRRAPLRSNVQPAYLRYLRPEAEIAALSGEAVLADVRVNADGTPDFTRWSRPQADGPALRSMALRRWWQQLPELDATLRSALRELISADLAFTLSFAPKPCFDVWEEVSGYHYYTQLLQAQALTCGAEWLEQTGQPAHARVCRVAADKLAPQLDAFWSDAMGFYRSHSAATAGGSGGELDIAVILGVLHAARACGSHSVLDPKAQATLTALEELFEAEYAINRELPPGRAAAMGRYANDRYYSGGAYFFATLAAAEFYFRLAAALRAGATIAATRENRRFLQRLGSTQPSSVDSGAVATLAMQRGDAFLRTVQQYTPAGGELSEQFDRTSGVETSARHLSWSYAAFITAAASRAQACQATPGSVPLTPPAGTA